MYSDDDEDEDFDQGEYEDWMIQVSGTEGVGGVGDETGERSRGSRWCSG